MNKSTKERQEGVIIFLVIVSVGSVIIGILQHDITLIFTGVAVILLDTVLLIDYDHRCKLSKTPDDNSAWRLMR